MSLPLSPGAVHLATPSPEDPIRPVYDRAVELFRQGRAGSSTWAPVIIFGVLIALAFGMSRSASSLTTVVTIVGAVLISDVFRWAAIHLLGYPDRDLLILPFFRVVLPQDGDRTPQWKKGLVILMGPFPGLVLAFILVAMTYAVPNPELRHMAMLLAFVSAFMLIPLRAFDGGRLLSVVLFSRFRSLELVFGLLTVAALAWAGLRFKAPVSYVLAFFLALPLKNRYRSAGAAMEIAARHPDLSRTPSQVSEGVLAELFAAADGVLPAALQAKARKGDVAQAKLYATYMGQIHDAAVMVPPSWGVSIVLLGLYGAGIVVAAVTLAFAVMSH